MADGTVDNLNIQITAEAKSAEKSLDSLSATLLKVNRNLQSSVGTIRKVSKEVGTLKTAIDSISKIGNVDFNSSGIGKTMNSLKRLLGADMSKFNTEGFKNITDTIRQFGSMPDISNSVNRFVSSIARLASAGSKTKGTADNIKRLGEQTRLAAQELKGIGNISNDLNMFVQSIGRLASAGNKTGQTASNLRNLANETYEFFKVMSKAPHISENTIRMTQALAQLASAGGKVSTATNTISKAFNKLTSIGGKTLSAMKKIASGITSAFKQIGTSSKQVDTARISLGSLLKTAIGFRLGYGLLQFGQQAFELGSAITEVENVVDVAFGSMADKAYEFASTATEQYGLSELAAKQYAGTMMAMLNSTGVAQDAAAEMSTTLAGLAGDLASFYNISTDDAFMKLRSAIAGETEPMRQLGINMTVAALQSYALSQGITKSWQSMTQAEQAMLRYNYIMSATSQQQGDYQRTVGSFANQWRLLTLNVQQFAAVVGQGLIAAVLPAIQAINALFSVLMRAAEAFRNFMYVLTGYKGQGSQGGIVNEMAGIGDVSTGLEDIGASGGDASSGMDDATDSAKDLKKALSVLSFDELNQLSSNLEDIGDAGSAGGGGGLDDINVPGTELGGFDDMIDVLGKSKLPEAVNEWAERLRAAFLDHDWDRLGKEIAWGINKGLQAIYDVINWDNAKKKIIPFINGFTQTFNSLVDAIDWDLLGRTVGAGINTIVNSANLLMEGIDWVNLGRKFSEGINGLLYEVDWNNFGRMLGNYFMISWDIFGGFVEDLDFAKIGRSVAEGLNGVFSEISFGDIAHYLATALNGAFDSLAAFAVNFRWDDLVNNIVDGISTFIEDFEWTRNALKLTTFLNKLATSLGDLAADIPWEDLGKDIGNFLGTALGDFKWEEAGRFLNEFITGLVDALKGFVTKDNFEKLGAGIADALGQIEWLDILRDVAKMVIDAFAGLLGGIWESDDLSLLEKGISTAFLTVQVANITGISALAKTLIGFLAQKLQTDENLKKMTDAFKTIFATSAGDASSQVTEELGKIGTSAEDVGDKATTTGGILSTLKTILSGGGPVSGTAGIIGAIDLFNKGQEDLASYKDGTYDAINTISLAIQNAGDASGISAWKMSNLLAELGGFQYGSETFNEAFDGIIAKLDDAGISSDDFKLALYNAMQQTGLVTGEYAELIKTYIGDVGDSFGDASNESKKMKDSVSQNTREMKNSTKRDLAGVASDAENYFAGVNDTTVTNWGNSTEEVKLNLRAMKLAASEQLANMTETVRSYSQSMYNIFTGKFEDIKEQITREIGSMDSSIGSSMRNMLSGLQRDVQVYVTRIANEFSGLSRRISNNMQGMYNVGRNAAIEFANGIRSVHIPMPHISVNSNTWYNGSGYSYSMSSSVNWYKMGGLFATPAVIGVGEAGKEAVLPLENRRTMSMIADSIMGNATTGMSEEALTNAVTAGVTMALMNNQGNQTPINLYATLYTEDNEVLARAVARGQEAIDYRTNPTPQFG